MSGKMRRLCKSGTRRCNTLCYYTLLLHHPTTIDVNVNVSYVVCITFETDYPAHQSQGCLP